MAVSVGQDQEVQTPSETAFARNAAESKQDRRRALTFTDVVTLPERETASDLMVRN